MTRARLPNGASSGSQGKVVGTVGARASRRWRVVLAVLLVLPLAGACKKKGPRPGEGGAGAGAAGLGEEGLAGGGSSLERAKRGLGPEEDGILGDVHFGYDSFELDATARDVIARNLQWLRENSRAKVELEGHADSRGTIEYNLALGAKRAKAVKDQLVTQGISADRISTISYGKELPLCHEENETCWARNRRVHAVILGQ
jgi:peptidoglycan-associated lipoprotein